MPYTIPCSEESARPPLSDIKKNVWVEKGAHVKMQPLQTKFTSAFLAVR